MVTKKITSAHRAGLFSFFSFLCEAGSDFDKEDNSLKFKVNDGNRQDKSYGLGRVVFHRSEPAVAAQAVSL
jgi:hypothetical protein